MAKLQYLTSYVEHLSYFGIFLLLAFVGYVLPFPEEIILLSMGYITALGYFNLVYILIVGIAAMFTGDIIVYWLSRAGSGYMSNLRKKFSSEKIKKYETMMRSHTGKTIFFLRFMPGVRILCPLLSGTYNIPLFKFMFYDLLALLMYVPLLVAAGYHFHSKILVVISKIEAVRHGIFIMTVILIGIAISFYSWKKFIKEKNILWHKASK